MLAAQSPANQRIRRPVPRPFLSVAPSRTRSAISLFMMRVAAMFARLAVKHAIGVDGVEQHHRQNNGDADKGEDDAGARCDDIPDRDRRRDNVRIETDRESAKAKDEEPDG